MSTPFVDVAQVKRRFASVAVDYPKHDFFAREIDRRMQERLDYVRLTPARILDLGCSRFGSQPGLAARYPEAQKIGVDLVPAMLQGSGKSRSAWQRWLGLGKAPLSAALAGDANALPLKSASIDLVWSNLLMHWLDDPRPSLAESHRVLSVGGLFMFSTLGPDSLRELRAAFADGQAHTQRFVDMHDFGDMLVECGFADPVMDMEMLTLTYDSLDALFAEMRQAGSSCAMTARQRGLSGRRNWQAMQARYEALRQDGKLPASFEVIYGHAWKTAPKQAADGRSIVRFSPRPPR